MEAVDVVDDAVGQVRALERVGDRSALCVIRGDDANFLLLRISAIRADDIDNRMHFLHILGTLPR